MHTLVIVIAKYAIVIPPLVFAYIFLRLNRKNKLESIFLAVASAIFTAVLVKLATTTHQDPRPFVRDGVHAYFASSTDNGFPSDHTALSALIGFVALYYGRKLGLALLALSILIGTCRVIAGVHHAQDIIGGFVIAGVGTALGVLFLRIATKLRTRQSTPRQ